MKKLSEISSLNDLSIKDLFLIKGGVAGVAPGCTSSMCNSGACSSRACTSNACTAHTCTTSACGTLSCNSGSESSPKQY